MKCYHDKISLDYVTAVLYTNTQTIKKISKYTPTNTLAKFLLNLSIKRREKDGLKEGADDGSEDG